MLDTDAAFLREGAEVVRTASTDGARLVRYDVAQNKELWSRAVNVDKVIDLDNYVITRDSSAVFLLSDGLFRISLPERRILAEPIPFTPSRLNITPDDRHLVLRESDSTLWLYDVETSELGVSFDVSQ